MSKTPVIAIFDIGKTNKKLFLFDEHYQIVYENTARFLETTDEDGDACENLDSLRHYLFDSLKEVLKIEKFEIRAINFSTYGASLVYLNEEGNPLLSLQNYLKQYPNKLEKQFYSAYGGKEEIVLETASPASGSLNSGLQLYRLKYHKPALFKKLKFALHLPQYMSYLLSEKYYSDMTSIGCHTHLWDFKKGDYHGWVYQENLQSKLAPIISSDEVTQASFMGKKFLLGVGLHDSSAALIPYMVNFREPFVLISTGTWCISLNPFNKTPLTAKELNNDCLAYISYQGKPVKAARLFAGNEHEQQVKRIADHFNVDSIFFKNMEFEPDIIKGLKLNGIQNLVHSNNRPIPKVSEFQFRDLTFFKNEKVAYHQLIADLIHLQHSSTRQVISDSSIKKIFVDGGFSKNAIYMNLLAAKFSEIEVYAAGMAQATALGTALAIHNHWNTKSLANDIIDLKYYSSSRKV